MVEAGDLEGVIAADVDAEMVRKWRREFPAIADMHWKD
jgi:hypothetical protein